MSSNEEEWRTAMDRTVDRTSDRPSFPDLLWFGLALYTAFRMLAGAPPEQEEHIPDDRAVA